MFDPNVETALTIAAEIARMTQSGYIAYDHFFYAMSKFPSFGDLLKKGGFPYEEYWRQLRFRLSAGSTEGVLEKVLESGGETPDECTSMPCTLALRRLLAVAGEYARKRGAFVQEGKNEVKKDEEGEKAATGEKAIVSISIVDVVSAIITAFVNNDTHLEFDGHLNPSNPGPTQQKSSPKSNKYSEALAKSLAEAEASELPPSLSRYKEEVKGLFLGLAERFLEMKERNFELDEEDREHLQAYSSRSSYWEEDEDVEDFADAAYSFIFGSSRPRWSPAHKTSGKSEAERTLEEFCIDLVQVAYDGGIDPVIGREYEIERALQILARRRKNNPIFVGEAGVGKTAIVEGIALLIALGDVPEQFKDSALYCLDLTSLVGGTKYRGEFEERMDDIIKSLLELPKSILYIDEIHNIWGAGSGTSDRTLDASNILKPHLANGKLRLIGATTHDEYRTTINTDRALRRRFQKITVTEPTMAQTLEIIKGLKKQYERFHHVEYTDEALEAAVRLSARHIHDNSNPDKSIDVIDEAGSFYSAFPERYENNIIDKGRIETVVARIARIPDIQLVSDEVMRLKELESDLKSRVFGQQPAIEAVVRAVKLNRAGLKRADRPIANLLFVGPTGVGKTELAKQLAQTLNVAFIRFDMSEYASQSSVSRFIGADPGYVGYEGGGQLTNAINNTPHCVLLLDEIEKAHPTVFNLLLQVMDAARLTDNSGAETSFRNVILIMTSNVGVDIFERNRVGFDRIGSSTSALGETIDEREIKKTFSPEFRNRLDAIVPFSVLNNDIVIQIVDKFVAELEFLLSERKIHFQLDPEVKEYFAKKGFDPKMGARPLDRVLQSELKEPLADEILFGNLVNGGIVHVSLVDGAPKLEFEPNKDGDK